MVTGVEVLLADTMPVSAAPPSFSGSLSLMVPHPVNLQGFSLSYWLADSPVTSLTVLVGDSPQSPPFSRRLADEHAYSPPSTVGGRCCDWLEPSPGEEEEDGEGARRFG